MSTIASLYTEAGTNRNLRCITSVGKKMGHVLLETKTAFNTKISVALHGIGEGFAFLFLVKLLPVYSKLIHNSGRQSVPL